MPPQLRAGPSSDDAHEVVFFQRHIAEVAAAPPKRFAGGGYWEAMKGVAGLDKPFRTTLSDSDYAAVRWLGVEYRSRNPRSII